MKITVEVDLAKCFHVKLEQHLAVKLVESIISIHGITKDLEEAKRIIENFDEYYGIAKRRYESYLVVPKDIAESIRGRTVVQKIKLIKNGDNKIVEFVFDKKVPKELIVKALNEIGYSEVLFEYKEF
ncbi:MAG: hypothetical protein QW251_04115 [Desulfurococcaceae archaeon]